MKTALTVIGWAVLAMGLFWACQGAGFIRWPAESFMISQTPWIYYGGATSSSFFSRGATADAKSKRWYRD